MTALEILRLVVEAMFILCLIGLSVPTLVLLRMTLLHLRLRGPALAREKEMLVRRMPPKAKLPDVLVQIPTFNEPEVVARGLETAAALDWPKDKLHIQLLDDSTDETTARGRAAVAKLRKRGFDAEMIHREDRSGFKAGALQFGIEKAPHPFIAMLDVDYVPEPDFLKQCMKPLLADDKLAFAQARFDYLNADKSWLTRAQRLMLDLHLAIEQATRSWSGQVLPFNGTCGVWRRAAIVDAGGWEGDTLAEDLDLSYRAHLKGWRAIYLLGVPVAGELPTDLNAWIVQQQRWTKGFAQVASKLKARIRDASTGWRTRLDAAMHMTAWWSTPFLAGVAGFGLAALILNGGRLNYLAVVMAAVVAMMIGIHLFAAYTANRLLREHGFGRFLVDCANSWALMVLSGVRNLRGVIEAKTGKSTEFVRTPKKGVPASET